MHLVIINCSPRIRRESNTNLIAGAFEAGYTESGNTAELHQLSETHKWDEIRAAYYNNSNILMAVPLYVECIPGIMAEFLETLEPKETGPDGSRTRLSFILQGGFTEASQYRCGEEYLKKLSGYLNCDYGGTLIKGDMFILHMMSKDISDKMVAPFRQMGRFFAQDGRFSEEKTRDFAGPEHCSRGFVIFFTLVRPVHKLFFQLFFKKHGCRGSLNARPYESYIRRKSLVLMEKGLWKI